MDSLIKEVKMTKKVFVAISRTHARVWSHGLEPHDDGPIVIDEPSVNVEYQNILNKFFNGRNRSLMSASFAERVLAQVQQADELFLVGAGKGKASAVGNFISYLRKQHPQFAEKVRRIETVDLENLTEGELMAVGRKMMLRP
jgi:hypothetical protein